MSYSVKNRFEESQGNKNRPVFNENAVPISVSFAATAGAANVCEVAITFKDGYEATLAKPLVFEVWLSDASTGAGLTATSASGTVTAKSASGTVFDTMVSKKALTVQALATGIFTLEITDTAKTGFYVCIKNPFTGLVEVSDQLVTGDYGS